MIISLDTEISLTKSSAPPPILTVLESTVTKGPYLDIIKAVDQENIANIKFYENKSNPLKSGTR